MKIRIFHFEIEIDSFYFGVAVFVAILLGGFLTNIGSPGPLYYNGTVTHVALYQGSNNTPERIITVSTPDGMTAVGASCTYYDNATTIPLVRYPHFVYWWWIKIPGPPEPLWQIDTDHEPSWCIGR